MRFDLPAMVRATGAKRKVIPLAVITPTAAIENELAAIYIEAIRAWATGARDQIIPAYKAGLATAKWQAAITGDAAVADDVSGTQAEAATVDAQVSRLLLTLTPKLRRWVVRTESFVRQRWISSVQPTGVKLETLIGPADVKITMDAALQANVALIRSLSDEARTRIEGIVFRGFQSRSPARVIAKEISDGLAMSRRRALFIASHQTSMLSAMLASERRRQANLDSWIWRHSSKRHPRIVHLERDGKEYTDKTAPSDLPGLLPWCGCREQARLVLQ